MKTKSKEILKFMCMTAVFVVLTCVLAKVPAVFMSIFKYCTEVDKGWIWFINMAVAILVGWFVASKFPSSYKVPAALIVGFLTLIIVECLVWHPSEIGKLIVNGITWKSIATTAVTMVAAAIAFVLHIKDIDYGEEESEEDSEEPESNK